MFIPEDPAKHLHPPKRLRVPNYDNSVHQFNWLRHETATSPVFGFNLPLEASHLPQLIHASQQHASMLRYYLRIITIVSYVLTHQVPARMKQGQRFEVHFELVKTWSILLLSIPSHHSHPLSLLSWSSGSLGCLLLIIRQSHFTANILKHLLFIIPT